MGDFVIADACPGIEPAVANVLSRNGGAADGRRLTGSDQPGLEVSRPVTEADVVPFDAGRLRDAPASATAGVTVWVLMYKAVADTPAAKANPVSRSDLGFTANGLPCGLKA